VGGIEESLLRALTKIERVLPSRLRHRVNTPQLMTVRVPSNAPKIEASTLTTIASACREHEQLRFDYSDHAQARSRRGVEPYRLVGWGRR
jgi:predicted DNA-binding transcriptional regulator YafY